MMPPAMPTPLSRPASIASAALAVALALTSACGGRPATTSNAATHDVTHGAAHEDARLAEVARAHGGAGPWAVSGYRMGAYALEKLGLARGSFDLEITHYTPREVQYACIADGASASTGASVGKLNLSLADAPAPETRTVYRRKSTGQTVTLRVTKAFAARFLDVPREKLGDAGREAMRLPDADIFEVVP